MLVGRGTLTFSTLRPHLDSALVHIRRATERDASAIATVLHDAFAEVDRFYTRAGYTATTTPAEQIRTRLAEGPTWVAEDDGRVVGTMAAVKRESGVYVRSMGVAPAGRGKDAGRALMRQLELFAISTGAPRMYLSTTPFLFAAIRLYESLGFRRTGEPPDELFGTPLFTMARPLAR